MKQEKKSSRSPGKAAAKTPAKKKSTASRAAARKNPDKSEKPPSAKAKKAPPAKEKPAVASADEASAKTPAASKGPGADAPAKAAAPKSPPAKKKEPLKVPNILLEGDASPRPRTSGPGSRYALAPEAPVPHAEPGAELPDSYGTGRLFLAARDPHWLYASWDLKKEDQKKFNSMSREGHLVIKVFRGGEEKTAVPDVHVHPESRNWFIHVPDAETRYYAVLGYYDRASDWNELARSRGTLTPPDAPSSDQTAEFATIPRHVTFQTLQDTVKEFIKENIPLVRAVLKSSPEEQAQNPAQAETQKPWPLSKATELAKMVTIDNLRRVWMGSLEITELIRRRLQEEVSSMAAAAVGVPPSVAVPGSEAITSISSPFGGMPGRDRKFWFNVNAELIIYGATEPNAKVTIAGRKIRLRPDGSFSFRFSLPDGQYQLPAVAVSPDGVEAREAKLHFSRASQYSGKVDVHPQDSALKPPRPESIKID